MGHAEQKAAFAVANYLNWDASQTERHVYVCGNLCMALRPHLRGSPCRTYMSEMKLNVASANQYFYPDVMVTCSATDQANPLIKSEPKLIIEVLSPQHCRLRPGLEVRLLPRDCELAGIRTD